jgi:hypothetical protein
MRAVNWRNDVEICVQPGEVTKIAARAGDGRGAGSDGGHTASGEKDAESDAVEGST